MKQPPIPSTIRIAGTNYIVEEVPTHPGITNENIGSFSQGQATIVIDAGIQPWRKRKVLLHELVHAADCLFGSSNLTEEQVVTLENGLWSIFNDNPGLARAIFGSAA